MQPRAVLAATAAVGNPGRPSGGQATTLKVLRGTERCIYTQPACLRILLGIRYQIRPNCSHAAAGERHAQHRHTTQLPTAIQDYGDGHPDIYLDGTTANPPGIHVPRQDTLSDIRHVPYKPMELQGASVVTLLYDSILWRFSGDAHHASRDIVSCTRRRRTWRIRTGRPRRSAQLSDTSRNLTADPSWRRCLVTERDYSEWRPCYMQLGDLSLHPPCCDWAPSAQAPSLR
ncbi:hypothetical protein BT67DRAFT_123254 [Trichocladium antarcticum]|uniref:Uncharacterized protein n=1 Tax=Trichocladium antarcticum TaxID=1450529 RepID=A0AAN6URW2_9PEZI|nr:hypothetical protein BT67DRAFT_123254 [Trichocladium antarcticum]